MKAAREEDFSLVLATNKKLDRRTFSIKRLLSFLVHLHIAMSSGLFSNPKNYFFLAAFDVRSTPIQSR